MDRLTRKDFDVVRFPNGEIKLILNKTLKREINWKYNSDFANGKINLSPSEELVLLFQLDRIVAKHNKSFEFDYTDGLTTKTHSPQVKVYADFLPFKRQDKDKLLGEIKFNDIYNLMYNIDLHEVAPHDSKTFAEYALSLYRGESFDYNYVVFPDCGAQERFKNFKTQSNMVNPSEWIEKDESPVFQDIVTFNKSRNADNGKLEFEEFKEKLSGTAVIFDDICAYGGTFKHVATELKKAGAIKVKLVVNHADADSKGKHLYNVKEMKAAGIDEIVILNGGL